jgi:hypothetical protein
MAYWLGSALLFILSRRDERRHLKGFCGAVALALLVYSPNFAWNLAHGFVSYRHTGDNAALGGPLFHPERFLAFTTSQFAVFGPLLMGSLVVLVVLARRSLADRRGALLAWFALPTLGLVLALSLLSHAEPNWAAPAYVAATVLVTAWLIGSRWAVLVPLSVALHAGIVTLYLGAHALGYQPLPTRLDPLHRLQGWKPLGRAVGRLLIEIPGVHLLADSREEMAALVYYVEPHPFDALKWNGDDGRVHDQFDLTADPERYLGQDFLLVAQEGGDTGRVLDRFAEAGPPQHIVIPLGGGEARRYTVRLLRGFKGYR